MRIVAGEWKGRKISAPAGLSVRPTGDRVREAWMSILQNELPGASVLDLFAGSGALGLEALSRGAASAEFVESSATSLRVLRGNIEELGAAGRSVVHRIDALTFLANLERQFDVAFADPPYAGDASAALAEVWLGKPFSDVLGVEHDSRRALPAGGDTRRYGSASITIYRKKL